LPEGNFCTCCRRRFNIAGKKTPVIQPGATTKLTVRIAKVGRCKYLCTVPGHAAAGMRGTFIIG
jgi:uncharacterized cupredoxin-like copper-binding protein